MNKDNLGDRMKVTEDSYRIKLPIRMPVILRIDGKAFHQYTKGCKQPVDENLVNCMNLTAMELCKKIQGVQLAYIQSDEISLLLNNYKTNETQPWFDNNLQKMVSVSASIASTTFSLNSNIIWNGKNRPAYFDSRAFVIAKEDVNNYFLWRQNDATRNSLQMLARSLYSHAQLNKKDNKELQELCFQKGFNWNDCPTTQKRGRCIIKQSVFKPYVKVHLDGTTEAKNVVRSEWFVDNEIPIFSKDKEYVDKCI